MTRALRALMNRYAMPAFERQLVLADLLGPDHEWTLSVAQGTASFGPGRTWGIQLLGTKSDESDTWLWAWANEDGRVPARLLAAARKCRQVGRRRNVEELERPELQLGHIDAHTLALAATGIAELGAYYRFPYEGGALFAGVDASVLPPDAVDLERMRRVVDEILTRLDVDPALSFRNYAELRGARVDAARDRLVARWPDGRSLELDIETAPRPRTAEAGAPAAP